MEEYKTKSVKFVSGGMSLRFPFDMMPEGKFPYLKNIRFDKNGAIQARNKLTKIKDIPRTGAETDPIVKIKRLTYGANDIRLIHRSDRLYRHDLILDTLTEIDSGFSLNANSTSIVSIEPEESTIPWIYLSNSNKFKKHSSENDYFDVGISPPNSSPTVKSAASVELSIDELGGTLGSWTNHNGAGALTSVTRVANTTTIAALLFDSGSSGWASIVPNTFPEALQQRVELVLNDATVPVSESIIVNDVCPSYLSAGVATISSIKYDSGVNGDCTIHLTVAPTNIKKDAVLLLGGTEYVRIKGVVQGTQGNVALRVTTVGTFAAGATVEGKASFRAFLANGTYTVATTISTNAMKIPFAASGVGYAQRLIAIDLSKISNRPIGENDVIRFAVLVSDTAKLEEGQFQIDLSGGSFTNYLFFAFTPSSLTQTYKQTESILLAQQEYLQRQQLLRELYERRVSSYEEHRARPILADVGTGLFDPSLELPPDISIFLPPIITETSLGDAQWTIFEIPIKNFIRVGTDESKTLKDVGGFRFSFRVNAAVDIYVDSLSIGGTYELDSGLENEGAVNPYFWIYRYRSSATRAISNWSPPQRGGLFLKRGRSELNFIPSTDPQVDKIDIARFGGRLTNFHYIGTTENSSSSFFDELPDSFAIQNPIAVFDNYKPFAILDKSRKGTCDIKGSDVIRLTGDNFGISWPRGTQIIINGVPNKLYNSPSDIDNLILENSVGTLVGATWYIPEPLLTGQTLPVIFGPFGEGYLGLVVFGLGNENAKGTVYWLNGNNPDSMSDLNYLRITDPSEPLIDGVVYRNIPYVFTNKRCFSLNPSINEDGRLFFVANEVQGVKGLATRGAIAVGDRIYFVSHDGIYSFDGGSVSIISAELSPLFLKEGTFTEGDIKIGAINLGRFDVENGATQLAYYQNKLYYFEPTTSAIWVFDVLIQEWISVDHSSFVLHYVYGDESQYSDELLFGGIGGGGIALYCEYDGMGVEEAAFSALALTPLLNCELAREVKEIFEFQYDYLTPNHPSLIEISVWLDNFSEEKPLPSITSIGTSSDSLRQSVLRQLDSVYQVKNFALEINFFDSTSRLFEVVSSYLNKGQVIQNRYTDWSDLGFAGSKFIRGIIIDANTFNVPITLQIETDSEILSTFIIQHDGQKRAEFPIEPAVYAHLIRLRQFHKSRDFEIGEDWILYDFQGVYEQVPDDTEAATAWTNDGEIGAKLVRGVIIDADTENEFKFINVEHDNPDIPFPLVGLQHDGRREAAFELAPFVAHNLRLNPTSEGVRIFEFKFIYDKWAENAAITTEWNNGGTALPKLLKAIVIDANTNNAQIDATLYKEGNTQAYLFAAANGNPLQHNGRQEKVYAIDTKIIGYQFKIVPSADLELFSVRYIYDEVPDYGEIETTWLVVGDGERDRLIKGLIIDADTSMSNGAAADAELFVDRDESGVVENLVINHVGRMAKTYELQNPFVGKIIRLRPRPGFGNARIFNVQVISEEWAENAAIATNWDAINTSGEKYFRGLVLEADTNGLDVVLEIQKEGEITVQSLVINHTNRGEKVYNITPFYAHKVRLVPLSDCRIFNYKWEFEEAPELSQFPTKYFEENPTIRKYLQRIELDADTGGVNVNLNIEDGEGNVVGVIVANHNGRSIISYDFPPIEGYLFRIIPLGNIRIFNLSYKFDIQPPKVKSISIQSTTFDMLGFKTIEKGFFTIRSTAIISLSIAIDGIVFNYSIPSTGNVDKKVRVDFDAIKGKLFEIDLASVADFVVYKKDCEMHVYSIKGGSVQPKNPFGHISREIGSA